MIFTGSADPTHGLGWNSFAKIEKTNNKTPDIQTSSQIRPYLSKREERDEEVLISKHPLFRTLFRLLPPESQIKTCNSESDHASHESITSGANGKNPISC